MTFDVNVMEKIICSSDQLLAGSSAELITFFQEYLGEVPYSLLFELLDKSVTPLVRLIVRRAIKCREKGLPFDYSLAYAERRCLAIATVSRRKFVRRVYAAAPLFALGLIGERYPHYTAAMLAADLVKAKPRKPTREKFIKRPSEMGFRISMIRYLSGQLRFKDLDPALYHRYCNKIAGYQNGLNLRLPIILPVVYHGQMKEYYFPWNETKFHIDAFVALTKRVSSFEALDSGCESARAYGN
jgi:hypothetical protein